LKWERGRAEIDRMLADHKLDKVPASREQASRLIGQARTHLQSAAGLCEADPPGAYALAYDAARKALTAVLENQGLRPTSAGGHIAVYEAVRAQFDPPLGKILRPFDRMRRQRRDAEYPPTDAPELTPDDVREDLEKAIAIVDMAARVLDEMAPY
jgi:hypothetical protein